MNSAKFGMENQKFHFGQQVVSSEISPITIRKQDEAEIIDLWKDCGYWYYDITFHNSRMKNRVFRQIDLKEV